MPSLQKRRGKWNIAYYVATPDGKLTKRYKVVSANRSIANEALSKWNAQHERQKFGLYNPTKPWREFCQQYLDYSRANKARKSVERDEAAIKQFNDIVRITSVSEYTATTLEQYKAARSEKGLKPGSTNRDLNTLKAMGAKLVEWGYLSTNPVKMVRRLKDRGARKLRFLLKEEVAALLGETSGVWKTAVMISLYTGMREGEVCHVTWDDVDFGKGTITVCGHGEWHPKDSECRTIPLHPDLAEHLSTLRGRAKDGLEAILTYHGSRYASTGRVREQALSTMTRKIMKRAGIQNASFHTLRHTFASHLVMSGVDLYPLSKLLGHSSVVVTEIYAHLRPKHLRDQVLRLDYDGQGA